MKSTYSSFSWIKAEKLGNSAVFCCLLITLFFITILKQSSHPLRISSFQLSVFSNVPCPTVKEFQSGSFSKKAGNESVVSKQVIYPEKPEGKLKLEGNETEIISPDLVEKLEENNQVDVNIKVMDVHQVANVKQEQIHTVAGRSEEQNRTVSSSNQKDNQMSGSNSQVQIKSDKGQEGRIVCDLSEARSDTCSMFGDIRVLSSSYTILLAMSSQSPFPLENYTNTQTIKPYARKWEPQSMKNIKELSLKTSTCLQQNLTCNLKHDVPAIIFSTGGFLGNFFHDFTDVLIPLFVTSRQFNGNVQFLVTDFNAEWINKYKPILLGLSRFDIINMDIEKSIHCFPYVHVGLKSHKVLGIDPSKTPKGYTMSDFKKFLRETFSLKRSSIKKSRRKPRLLMILRKGSRSIMNEKEVVMTARRIGYKVITAQPEEMKDLSKFADIVNSCDVMMGVHGAGLANMVFLPENSTLIQIIPLGGLTWACRHDYGEPAPDMGIKYLEYEIKDDESSLIKQYPRDHAVFKDPFSIHRQGWNQLWSIFLDKQKVRIDVARFRSLLLEIYHSVKQ